MISVLLTTIIGLFVYSELIESEIIQDGGAESELIEAIKSNNIIKAKELIKAGSNLDLQDTNGNTAIMFASGNGNIEIAKELIKAGANLDLQNKNGWTALMFASAYGKTVIAKELIKAGANLDIQKDGSTALMFASAYGKTVIVKELIKAGAKPDLQDNDGSTALMFAIDNGNTEIAKELIKAGANIDLKDNSGKTAVDYARTEEMRNLLVPKVPKVPRDSEPSENWHNQCKEEKDLISQETWKDSDMSDPDQDIIFIKWDPTRKEECYNANDIETFKNNKDIHVVEWVHNGVSDLDSLSMADKNSGMGYAPKKNSPVYMKLWPLDNYVSVKSVEKMLKSKKRHFIAKQVGSKRIGNIYGTRGVSEVHGQMPESKLYELVAKY
jgi:hypothetical protein